MTLKPEITIRRMVPSDAADAARLSAELGYPVLPHVMEERINLISTMTNHAVFAACLQDRTIAWIDVGIVHHLQSEPYGEIGGLIVSERHHGCGIGRLLISTAEKWIATREIEKVVVRSQISREGAHAFYLRQNFAHTKTSAVFTKLLAVH